MAEATTNSNKHLAASIGKNTLFGVISNIAQVVTRLVTVPIVIHHLGLGGYGIWNIIVTTATYMRFGSVGVKTAFQKYVAEATGNGDYQRANQLLSTGFAVMLALSVAGLIPVALLSTRIAQAAGVPQEFLKSASGAIALLAWIMVMANVGATFEAIVMGGHRIDLVRKFGTALTVAEAVAIVVVLYFGQGLYAMAAVMGISELLYITACYFASKKVVPEIKLSFSSVTPSVLPELFRFAGSYQLVNLLEVLYGSILPFGILRAFGAESAGIYAVVARVVTSAAMLLDAFLPPILSSGSMVYASGSAEKLQLLLVKAFKVTLALSLFPLGFIAVFGSTMAYAWTGQTGPAFRTAFFLVCLTAFFRAFSLLALVLYRISGKALLDNIRQVMRIAIILVVVAFAHQLGFFGVLAGLALAELSGMVFMLFALAHTFQHFQLKALVPDMVRMSMAAALILGAGVLASYLPLPGNPAGQSLAVLKLAVVGCACLLVAWPSLTKTGSLDRSESRALFGNLLGKKNGAPAELAATPGKP
jgi:O-antigen/teichoic acid export membrane protein